MKIFASIIFAFISMAAVAFDSVNWQGKRELFAREAERLQAVYAKCKQSGQTPAEDVFMPVETFPSGAVKTLIQAKRAQYFLGSGYIYAEGVTVKSFDEKGKIAGQVDARSCVIDKEAKSAWAEGAARVIYEGATFIGKGVYVSMDEFFVKVYADADIEIKSLGADKLEYGGVKKKSLHSSQTNEVSHITSSRCDFDREDGVCMFENNVKIVYANEYTMTADQLYAFTTSENQLNRCVAIGNVSIVSDSRTGTCSRAVYRKLKKEVEMFGDETRSAKLVEKGKNASVLEGARIKYWLDSEQAEIDNSCISVGGVDREKIL